MSVIDPADWVALPDPVDYPVRLCTPEARTSPGSGAGHLHGGPESSAVHQACDRSPVVIDPNAMTSGHKAIQRLMSRMRDAESATTSYDVQSFWHALPSMVANATIITKFGVSDRTANPRLHESPSSPSDEAGSPPTPETPSHGYVTTFGALGMSRGLEFGDAGAADRVILLFHSKQAPDAADDQLVPWWRDPLGREVTECDENGCTCRSGRFVRVFASVTVDADRCAFFDGNRPLSRATQAVRAGEYFDPIEHAEHSGLPKTWSIEATGDDTLYAGPTESDKPIYRATSTLADAYAGTERDRGREDRIWRDACARRPTDVLVRRSHLA